MLALVLACSSDDENQQNAAAPVEREPTPTPVITNENGLTRMVVYLSPTEGDGQVGTASFVSDGETTTIEVSIAPMASEAQPMHIHAGICTDVGPVLHALENVVRGSSSTIIQSPLEEILEGGALVNVHASYTDASTYTACGQLPNAIP